MTPSLTWLNTGASASFELPSKTGEIVLVWLLKKAIDAHGSLAEVGVFKQGDKQFLKKAGPSWLKDAIKARRIDPSNVLEVRFIADQAVAPELEKQILSLGVALGKPIMGSMAREGIYLFPLEGKLRKLKVALPNRTLKVLVVDDSETIRNLLSKVISSDPSLECVGTVALPSLVEAAIEKFKPDVLTLDIHMPEMNGVELLKKLMPKFRLPALMISSLAIEDGTLVLDALEAGAVDYIQKPSFAELKLVAPIICEKIKYAASANVKIKASRKVSVVNQAMDSQRPVLIGSSTGGTEALREILTALPKQIPPIVIVQHIPPVFSKAFADRLNSLCEFEVKEAVDGDAVIPNRVLIAPGGMQMSLREASGTLFVKIENSAPVNRHKPSVDVLFDSAVKIKSRKFVAGILTGMGADGAKGLLALRSAGARTFAQNEASCVVYGMPREAVKINAAEKIVALDDIAAQLVSFCQETKRKTA